MLQVDCDATIRAIDNGANALAEGFLFSVAAALIIGETWRSSRNQSKRRDEVDDQLEDLQTKVQGLTTRLDTVISQNEERYNEEVQRYAPCLEMTVSHSEQFAPNCRNEELTRILERVVSIGLRGGWAEL